MKIKIQTQIKVMLLHKKFRFHGYMLFNMGNSSDKDRYRQHEKDRGLGKVTEAKEWTRRKVVEDSGV